MYVPAGMTAWRDVTGQNPTAATSGTQTVVQGDTGPVMSFTGASSFASTTAFVPTPGSVYTIVSGFFLPTNASLCGIYDFSGVRLTVNEGTNWTIDQFGLGIKYSSTTTVSFNTWINHAITCDGTTFSMFFNGVTDATTAASISAVGGGLYIAGLQEGFNQPISFKYISVYSQALSAALIAALAAEPFAMLRPGVRRLPPQGVDQFTPYYRWTQLAPLMAT